MATTPPAFGFNSGILRMGKETTWGTEAVRTKEIEYESSSLGSEQEPQFANVIAKTYRTDDEIYQSNKSVSGDVVFPTRYEGSELLLEELMGSVTTSEEVTSQVYKHTFKFSDIVTEGLSLEKVIDPNLTNGKTLLYTGAKVNQMSFSLEPGGLLSSSISFICKDEEEEATPTTGLTRETKGLVKFNQCVLTWDSVDISCKATNFGLTVNKNQSSDRFRLCSNLIKRPVPSGKTEVTGTITVEFDVNTYYTTFKNMTQKDFNIKFTGDEITSGYNYEYEFDMNYVYITGYIVNAEDQNIITVDMPFVCVADDSANREIDIIVQNTLASF